MAFLSRHSVNDPACHADKEYSFSGEEGIMRFIEGSERNGARKQCGGKVACACRAGSYIGGRAAWRLAASAHRAPRLNVGRNNLLSVKHLRR